MRPLAIIAIAMLTGCSSPLKVAGVGESMSNFAAPPAAGQPLAVLAWLGGLSIIAGMALMVITAGRKGKIPMAGGVGLVLLNYAVLRFENVLFIPLVSGTGIISLAWTVKIVRQILMEKRK